MQYFTMHVIILDHIQHLNFDLSRSLKVKCDGGFGLPIPPVYDFLLVFNSNIWPNSAAVRDISLWCPSELDIDLSRSLRVKCDSVIGLPICGFYLCLIVTYGLTLPLLQDHLRKLQSLSDLDFDRSRSLKVKCDGVIGLSIYGFLLIYINNHRSISHRLAVIATQNVFSPISYQYKV